MPEAHGAAEATRIEGHAASDIATNVGPTGGERPTPHLRKLEELLTNDKLDEVDIPKVEDALLRYQDWIAQMSAATEVADDKVFALVDALNAYKRYIELDLIWDSAGAFLFRNRGQTKLDNSIMEEFLPWLIDPDIVPGLDSYPCEVGPHKAFAAASFESTLLQPGPGGGLRIRTKDQDFTLGRRAYLRSSFNIDFPSDGTSHHEIHLAYVAAECKTNLDKTMFQEASATAHDLRLAMPASRYYLIAEYLDMRPISTAGTDVEEVLILRGRRMGAQMRKNNSDPKNRASTRSDYVAWLDANPIRHTVVLRLVNHIRALFSDVDLPEEDILSRGYF